MQDNVNKLFKAKGMVDIKQVQRLVRQLSWASGLFPWLKCFSTMLWGGHHGARDRAVLPEVVQEETTWSTLLRCENPKGAGLDKVDYQWAYRDAGAQVECTKMDRRQYTVSDDAHRLLHRCFTTRVRCHPFCQRRANCVARGQLGEFQLVRCRARRPSLAIRVGITRSVTGDRYVVAPSSRPTIVFVPIRFHRYFVCSHACFRQNPSHECAAEIALRLECANVFTVPEHVADTLNFDCDALSRLSEGAQLPAILGNVRCDVPKPRQPGFFLVMACYVACWPSEAVQCMWAGRLRQEGETGFAALGPAKRTAALKGKLKEKEKGDQAQQPGAHSVPVDKRARRPVDSETSSFATGATTTAWVTNNQRKDLPDI